MSGTGPDAGPDFEDAPGDEVGFQDVALQGTKMRVCPPWPADQIPPTTASLLSIASRKGLVAIAGPDGLRVSSTERTRRTYIPRPEGDAVRPFEPDATLSVPRVSHVAFNADESCLIIAAEQGGGLAVYDTNQLGSGAQPAFQIGTNNTSVRHLLPNPSTEQAHLVGLVLTNGSLVLADLKSRGLVNNANGSAVFHENVSAASWSKLGKQIVAGRSDSTAVQIDTQGNVKSEIPRPPQLPELLQDEKYSNVQALPITSISWLSTHEFFIVYSPSYPQFDDMNENESLYFVAARAAKGEPLVFRRFSLDPCPPFGMVNRTPAHHFVLRINDWDTAADILILASSASTDISLLGRFKEGAQGLPGNEFVLCAPQIEARRAQLPMAAEDTSPLGLAIDLSTTEVAPRPVPSDETIQHSGKPLPALYTLNTDGILNIWWVVYNDAVRNQTFCPGIVHRAGRYAKYNKFTDQTLDVGEPPEGLYDDRPGEDEPDETEPLDAEEGDDERAIPEKAKSPTAETAAPQQETPAASPSPFGSNPYSNPASSQQQQPAFGQSSFGKASVGQGGTAAFGSSNALGQKASPWGPPSGGSPAQPSFGQSSFGQASTPGTASGFGRASTVGSGTTFGQASQPASGSGFGQIGQMGGNRSSPFAAAAANASASPFGQYASNRTQENAPSPFAGTGHNKASPFASAVQSSASPFATAGQNSASPFATGGRNNASPFAAASQKTTSPFASVGQKPGLSQETSTGSTATLGSGTSFGSFGQASGSGLGSSFASKQTVSRESTGLGEPKQGGGLSGLGAGFRLGSSFQGDGSARDDLPKPKTSDNSFGGGFGAALDATNNEKPIKEEPGTENQPSLQNIPEKKEHTGMAEDAPLPPDPSTYKAPKMPDDAPLPPDPSTYKAPKFPDDLPGLGGPKKEDKDVPIAGSPPVDVTNSQTFSPTEGSEEDGPAEEDDDDLEEEDGSDEDEGDEEGDEDGSDEDEEDWEEEDEEQEDEEEEEEEEEKPYIPDDPQRFANFMKRVEKPDPKSPESRPRSKQESRTPQSDEKTEKSSYTPAGLPKGPVFPPPANRTQQSPRSPSPQRAVTSPVRGRGIPETSLPSQIKTSAVPPAKPVPRPAAPPRPREKTAGELEDEAIQRVESLLAAPIEPSTDFPSFYTHTDYTGLVDNTGIGGQIERVFRDVNSMIHTVGLNARSLESFLQGQESLRKPGPRTIDDLDEPDAWCLGDLPDLSKLLDNIGKQLEDGKLEDVREKLEDLTEDHREVLKLKTKTTEMKKQVTSYTDPTQQAMREAAPLSAETQAQQTELRQSVQKVQTLLSEVEQKMSMLRADLASLSSKDGQKNGAPVPTVEAVTNTISRMTAMVQQKSADIDLLEAQIKRLPYGIASLRLDEDYEDDLASRLAGNRLLTDRNSPAATPPRRARMAANGDPLGMSGMFGASRFQTPPSGRRSMRFTPDASGLGRSTGSLGASTRKKMNEVSTEEVEMYQSRVQRRAKVLEALKAKVERRGAKIVKPE